MSLFPQQHLVNSKPTDTTKPMTKQMRRRIKMESKENKIDFNPDDMYQFNENAH